MYHRLNYRATKLKFYLDINEKTLRTTPKYMLNKINKIIKYCDKLHVMSPFIFITFGGKYVTLLFIRFLRKSASTVQQCCTFSHRTFTDKQN